MANSLVGRVWSVDTASATALQTGVTRVTSIRWVGPTAIGHTASVTDIDGNVVFRSRSSAIDAVDDHQFGDGSFRTALDVTDITVATLTSGVLYIEIAP